MPLVERTQTCTPQSLHLEMHPCYGHPEPMRGGGGGEGGEGEGGGNAIEILRVMAHSSFASKHCLQHAIVKQTND